jgi:hypothetical protein
MHKKIEQRVASEYNALVASRKALAIENNQTTYKTMDGMGQLVARISKREFMLARVMYGEDCWSDPQFVKDYMRDNPEVRVTSNRGTRGQEILKPVAHPKGTLFVPPKYANGN